MNALDHPVDGLAELGISPRQCVDLVDAMEDGRVISAAKRAADIGERGVREVTSDVHRDLSWEGDRTPESKALTGTNQLAIYVGRSRAATEAPMRQWLQTEWDVAAWSKSTIEHAIRGSVDECVEQLRAHAASGVHRIILIPYRYQPDQIEIIAKEIVPALR